MSRSVVKEVASACACDLLVVFDIAECEGHHGLGLEVG